MNILDARATSEFLRQKEMEELVASEKGSHNGTLDEYRPWQILV
jgi:hypothetical protein